jgi:alkylation response protein AidB-like acyl-CoA dehydrogenase
MSVELQERRPSSRCSIRDAVRALCATQFPDEYFRKVDAVRERAPTPRRAFVDALTQAGWMAALIPQEYGGSGLGLAEASVIMEEINRCGGNSGACHGQMYNMGTLLRHGSEAQKQQVPAEDRHRRAAPAVDGRDRADHRHRHHQDQDHGGEARATATWSTARRSGSRASSTPT